MRLWSLTAGLLLMSAPALAHWDFLLGVRNGRAAVILPQPHPLQTMSLLLGQYTRELGIEYYIDPNTNLAHLSGASIRTVWVSPNLIGRLNNQDIICASNCANYFTMNEEGHEHIRFRAAQRGIYIWDLKVVDATDINGNPVADMEGVYRIYFRAGNPHYLYGSVTRPKCLRLLRMHGSRAYAGSLRMLPLGERRIPICSPFSLSFAHDALGDELGGNQRHRDAVARLRAGAHQVAVSERRLHRGAKRCRLEEGVRNPERRALP